MSAINLWDKNTERVADALSRDMRPDNNAGAVSGKQNPLLAQADIDEGLVVGVTGPAARSDRVGARGSPHHTLTTVDRNAVRRACHIPIMSPLRAPA